MFIVVAVVTGSLAAYFYYQYNALETQVHSNQIQVDLAYGAQGHSLTWSNITVPEGTSLYQAMVDAGWKMNYTDTDPLLGYFITSINGVSQSQSSGMYWTYWVYTGGKQDCWYSGPSAANFFSLAVDRETVAWYLSAYNSTTQNDVPPPC